jgi:hypothetical protein
VKRRPCTLATRQYNQYIRFLYASCAHTYNATRMHPTRIHPSSIHPTGIHVSGHAAPSACNAIAAAAALAIAEQPSPSPRFPMLATLQTTRHSLIIPQPTLHQCCICRPHPDMRTSLTVPSLQRQNAWRCGVHHKVCPHERIFLHSKVCLPLPVVAFACDGTHHGNRVVGRTHSVSDPQCVVNTQRCVLVAPAVYRCALLAHMRCVVSLRSSSVIRSPRYGVT